MKQLLIAGIMGLTTIAAPSFAYEEGDWVVKFGAATVQPDGDGALDGAVDVEGDTQLGLTLTYMLSDNLGINLLAASPFTHDIELNGQKVGEASHLPPTLTLQYHFAPRSRVNPYLGAGVNYTVFFDEKSSLGDLSLDDSVGVAVEVGLDIAFTDTWGFNLAIWKADIETDADLDGAPLDTVKIDPWVFMLGAVYHF